jgi:hypothetical protein
MPYTPRQNLLIRALMAIVAKTGPFARDSGSEGAGYVPASKNTGAASGFRCDQCAFWRAPGGCSIMRGKVEREGICRFNVISQDRLVAKAVEQVSGNGMGRIRAERVK